MNEAQHGYCPLQKFRLTSDISAISEACAYRESADGLRRSSRGFGQSRCPDDCRSPIALVISKLSGAAQNRTEDARSRSSTGNGTVGGAGRLLEGSRTRWKTDVQ